MARATDPGTLLGTVGYMAPEQVRGHAATRARTSSRSGASFTKCWRGAGRSRRVGGRDDERHSERGAAGAGQRGREDPARPRPAGEALPGEEPGGALSVGPRPGVRPRVAVRVDQHGRRAVVRRGPSGEIEGRPDRPRCARVGCGSDPRVPRARLPRHDRGAVVPAPDVPAGTVWSRALRPGRPDGRLRRRVGEQPDRGLPDATREPGVAPLDSKTQASLRSPRRASSP